MVNFKWISRPGRTKCLKMSDKYIESVSERYIELYENITGDKFQKGDVSNIETRIQNNVESYLKD